MSATTADWSGIEGSGFDRSEVRHQIALSASPTSRSRLLAAAEIGCRRARRGRSSPRKRRRPISVSRRPADSWVRSPRCARPRRIRSAPAASRSKATGSGSTQFSGLRVREVSAGLGDELLREQDRVVLQLGVGAEAALEILGGPRVRAHVVGERRAVRGEHRLERVEPGVVDGRAPLLGRARRDRLLVGLHLACRSSRRSARPSPSSPSPRTGRAERRGEIDAPRAAVRGLRGGADVRVDELVEQELVGDEPRPMIRIEAR